MTTSTAIKSSQLLREAKELLEPRGAWTKSWYARNPKGEEVAIASPTAVSFDLTGALVRIQYQYPDVTSLQAVFDYLHTAIGNPDGISLPDWNDKPSRKKKHVLELLERAAVLAEEQGD